MAWGITINRPNQVPISLYRAVARTIIGGGGVYSYIRVLLDGFLLKSIVFTVCKHEYMNIHPP